MVRLSDEQAEQFAEAVRAAMGRDDLLLAIDCIHTQLRDAIELQRPRCDASGRCCRFEEYGHRLFVTTAEMAAFLTMTPEFWTLASPATIDVGCPFQLNQLCSVHATRPFGCRIFFCDPSADEWQSRQYERSHGQIKTLHDSLGIPYFYVEWREAFGCVAAVPRSTSTSLPAPK